LGIRKTSRVSKNWGVDKTWEPDMEEANLPLSITTVGKRPSDSKVGRIDET
jgi:hypothetical protein